MKNDEFKKVFETLEYEPGIGIDCFGFSSDELYIQLENGIVTIDREVTELQRKKLTDLLWEKYDELEEENREEFEDIPCMYEHFGVSRGDFL